MIISKLHLDFDNLVICPTESSNIKSRLECCPTYEDGMLPLFAAPMDTVVSEQNYALFTDYLIQPILPRKQGGYALNSDEWIALSLAQFQEMFLESRYYEVIKGTRYVCIDIANGHMRQLADIIYDAKRLYDSNLIIMAGNVANPLTYKALSDAGADYVRVGIGNGAGCWEENTLVLTEEGYKKISDITTNDKVLTHTGEYESVINTLSYITEEELIVVNGETCTKDHKLYVVNKSDVPFVNEANYTEFAFFIEAHLLSEDKHLIVALDNE